MGQWMHRPRLHSVKRLGEPRATPELPSIRTSQTATTLCLCVNQQREQASIPQLEAGIGNPLHVAGLEHHRRGTTCERHGFHRRWRVSPGEEHPFAIGAPARRSVRAEIDQVPRR